MDEIRKAIDEAAARLRAAIDTEIAQVTSVAEAAMARAKRDAEADADTRVAAVRAEAERVAADTERARVAREEQIRAAAMAEAFEAARAESAEAANVQVTEREGRLESVERLLASVRRIDAATSLRETLEVLVQSASLETPRVAVLLIEGANVRAFAHRGFADVPDAGPLAAGGVVEACVRHGQPAFTSDAAGLKAPGFAGLGADRAGFATPLRVGQRTVAVIYADDAGSGTPETPASWPEALELLARHASTHLENLTAVRVQQLPGDQASAYADQATRPDERVQADDDAARRYAKLLVSEIKLYNEASVRLGREHRDLRRRLRDEIEHAEQTYLDRIPETVAARRAYFEAELVETLGGGDAGALGPAT